MSRHIFKKAKSLRDTAHIHLSLAVRSLRLAYRMNPHDLILTLCITLVTAILPFVLAYTNARVLDEIVRTAQMTSPDLTLLGLYVMLALGTGYIVDFLWKYDAFVQKRLRFRLLREFGYLIHTKIISLDLEQFESKGGTSLLNRVMEEARFTPANYVNHLILSIFSLIQICTAIIMVFAINPLYILIISVTLVPSLIVSLKTSQQSWGIWSYKAAVRNKYWQTAGYMRDESMIKEIKIFGIANKLMKILKSTYEEFESYQLRLETKLAKSKMVAQTIEYLGWVYVYIDVLLQILQKSVTIGNFVLVRSILTDYSNTIKLLFENVSFVFEEGLWMRDMYKLLDTQTTIKVHQNPQVLASDTIPSIEFRHVSFKYPGTKKYIFRDLNFTIPSGEDVAIVGENGAGKTTLVKLLCRFYDVTSGQILIDGKNIKSLDLPSWHRQLGTLFQDFNKYAYTVTENLDLGTSKHSPKKLASQSSKSMSLAIAKASAEFVYDYPLGLQTILSRGYEDGVDPSGGQWQRIALARAFYRDAHILILDEPTSAIDARAEYEIFAQIKQTQQSKTTIIISHRFSTVRSAQRILVIKSGRIIESGSHDTLMQIEGGLYQTMFSKQAEGYQ